MSKRPTLEDLHKLGIKADRIVLSAQKRNIPLPVRRQRTDTPEKAALGLMLYALGERYSHQLVTEHRFHTERKFRFDWAFPSLMLAIEYEGLMNSKSGHSTIDGVIKDTVKYNLAQMEGWVVLRYTAKTYQQAAKDITDFIEKKL